MTDLAVFQSSFDENPKGWNDSFAMLMQSKLFDPDTKSRIQSAFGQVFSCKTRDVLTNAMSHHIDQEIANE